MGHVDVPQFVGLLVMLATAKALGACAQRIGQPAVLGELVAGVLLGRSVLGLVDPQTDVLHLFAELGVIILLFEIGLETNLRQLLQVGGAATVVALVGVALPFAFGYAVCWMLGFEALGRRGDWRDPHRHERWHHRARPTISTTYRSRKVTLSWARPSSMMCWA